MKNKHIYLLLLITLFSCTPKAPTTETIIARGNKKQLRKIIFTSKENDTVFAARLRLSGILYREAASTNGVAPLAAFLNEFSDTPDAQKARNLLEHRRYIKASTSNELWPLFRFLHLHPDSKYASKIKLILEKRWYSKALSSMDSEQLRKFLDYFPQSSYKQNIMEILSRVEFEKLGKFPLPNHLRMHAIAFAGTKYGGKSAQYLKNLIDTETVLTGNIKQISEIISKNPLIDTKIINYALKQLLKKSIHNLNFSEIESICELDKSVCSSEFLKAVGKWKKLKGKTLKKFRTNLQKSAKWAPAMSVSSILLALDSDDLNTSWTAMDYLSHIKTPQALGILLDRLKSPDPAIFWKAQKAVTTWMNTAPEWAPYFLEISLERAVSNVRNPENLQKYFVLARNMKRLDLKIWKVFSMRKIAKLRSHQLNIALMYTISSRDTSKDKLKFTEKLILSEISRLEQTFPESINKSNFRYARNINRRLFMFYLISRDIRKLLGLTVSEQITEAQIRLSYEKTHKKLSAIKNYEAPSEFPASFLKDTWNSERKKAINTLVKGSITPKFWKNYFKN
ncbi:MAG: HEAT repeat domain-containing protein [Deltaproteobacteria bacterium]|nr:HEAT repeat domain-containing protein [Deltaproteobacteria bacterium]